MIARQEYFEDVLSDAIGAATRLGVPEDLAQSIIAALIISDAMNGLRKAVLRLANAEGQQ